MTRNVKLMKIQQEGALADHGECDKEKGHECRAGKYMLMSGYVTEWMWSR